MRTQATIVPTFWTRGSGKKLRGQPVAQVLALYLMTSPHSTMIGLYYEALISILHETGLTEAQFRAALPLVSEIAQYDEDEGLVYLPEGAAHQIGERLSPADKKRGSILSQLEVYGNHRFVRAWVERYYDPYNLSKEGIARPDASPFDAPSMPHASSLHAPDPRSDQRSDPNPNPNPRSRPDPASAPPPTPDAEPAPAPAPLVASLQARAQLWAKDPFRASLTYPDPHTWHEMLELRDLVASTFGIEPDVLPPSSANGTLDARVKLVLERWAEGTEQARMRQAIRGAKQNNLIRDHADLQSLGTIFKDGNAVDKYCRLAKSNSPSKVDTSNRVTLTPEAAEKRRKFLAGE